MGFAAAGAPDQFSTVSPANETAAQRSAQGLPAPSEPVRAVPDSTSADTTWNPHAPGAAAAAAVAARLTAIAAAGVSLYDRYRYRRCCERQARLNSTLCAN